MQKYSYDRTNVETKKVARSATVKDSIDVKLTVLRASMTSNDDFGKLEYEVSGALEMHSSIGGSIRSLMFNAEVEVAGGNVSSVTVSNKGRLEGFGNYVEDLLEDSWHEWVRSLPKS